MNGLGFIHDMMDVKVLILFVMARIGYPASIQQIYEMCYQDDCLSYFDICTAVPEMVRSGHLQQEENGNYTITEKGRADGAATEDSIIYSLRSKAENAILRFNRQMHRSGFVETSVLQRENEEYAVVMKLSDEKGPLMTLELTAPSQRQALRLSGLFEEKAETVYGLVMAELLDESEE